MKIWNPKKCHDGFQTRGKKTTPKKYQKLEFQTLKDTRAPMMFYNIRPPLPDRKIKLRPVGLCYANGADQRSGLSLYRSTPSLSKFEQLNWTELTLPIKLFQFKICQLTVTDDA